MIDTILKWSQEELEDVPTAELLHLKMLISQILADRESCGGGEAITLCKPAHDYVQLVRLVREATGVGLREAKDMVDCGTTVRIADPERAADIKKILGKAT